MSSASSSSSSELSLPRICVRLNWTAWWWCATLWGEKAAQLSEVTRCDATRRDACRVCSGKAEGCEGNAYTMIWGVFLCSGVSDRVSAARACKSKQALKWKTLKQILNSIIYSSHELFFQPLKIEKLSPVAILTIYIDFHLSRHFIACYFFAILFKPIEYSRFKNNFLNLHLCWYLMHVPICIDKINPLC